jgi:hypothetical protein
MNVFQIFTYVASNVSTIIAFTHLVIFLIIVILKRKCIVGSRLDFFMHTFIEIITYRISNSRFLLKSTFVLVRNTQCPKIILIDHYLSPIVWLHSMIVILSLFFRIVKWRTFVFAAKLSIHLDKLRTGIIQWGLNNDQLE